MTGFVGLDGAAPRGYEGFGGTVAPVSSRSEPWWPVPQRAREGAPNVIVVLVDDLGYSDIGPFGSEIATPALDAIAGEGYRLTDFRVTPLCAPSRAALLTGANPHRAGFGWVPHVDPGYPGVSMTMPNELPTMAETFRENGYATFMVGKWHLTPEAKLHDGAEKSTWPLQRGFDRYYGSMEGFTTLFHPHRIVRDNSPATDDFGDDGYLTDALTTEAIGMIDAMRAGDGQRPFFLYFAHHAVHGPLQAKAGDLEHQRGAYDEGWDEARRARFERQRALGIVPEDSELPGRETPGFADTAEWASLSDEQRERYARHMEVYAAAVTAVDESVGRLVAHLREIGEYDNTIIVFTSDNGGTAEGGPNGTRSYFSQFIHEVPLPANWQRDVPRPLNELGGPRVHGHYPSGWAHVSNTPHRAYKGTVFEGGVRSPLIVSWPAGLPRDAADDGIRRGFAYVTDIAPTLFELAGVERPGALGGSPTLEADGETFASRLRRADEAAGAPGTPGADEVPERAQQISLMGRRAYYRDGWKLVRQPAPPGVSGPPPRWQLFDLASDPFETRDVASEHPQLVAELAEQWRRSAWHNTVFPEFDEPLGMATVPSTVLELSQPVTLRPGQPMLERYRSSRLVRNRSFAIELAFDEAPGSGVLVAHGDQGGGYLVWTDGEALHVSYNAYGAMHRASHLIDEATRRLTVAFDASGDVSWRISLRTGGGDAGGSSERVELISRVPMLVGLAPFAGISVGIDGAGPVDWELHTQVGRFAYEGSPFTARYVPGPRAPFDRELVRAVDEVSARLMD